MRLYVYSSGSRNAQDLFFRHNEAGDLRRLFSDFFDTGVGPRPSAAPMSRSAGDRDAAGSILFLSDSAAELRAAESAGLQVAQAVKEASLAEARWAAVSDFSAIEVAPAP